MGNFQSDQAAERSHVLVRRRFAAPEMAARYPAVYGGRSRDRRERAAVLRALACVPAGAWVLDLPCGTGRCTRLLAESGYRVTAADSSQRMVAAAREGLRRLRDQSPKVPEIDFQVADVLGTPFDTGQFDAVLCNRLLHHFRESYVRRAALRELRRIARGPLIVSFFNSFALDTLGSWLRRLVRGPAPAGRLHRVGISLRTFAADVAAADLRIDATIPARWAVSRQWYAVLRRA